MDQRRRLRNAFRTVGNGVAADSGFDRRTAVALVAIQTVTTACVLPLAAAFALRGGPLRLVTRWSPAGLPVADLGIPVDASTLTPTARQAAGLTDLLSVGLALAILLLAVGCGSLAAIVVRRGWRIRDQLTVRAAVGASRADLRRAVLGPVYRLLAVGGALGLLGGVGASWLLAAVAPSTLAPPDSPLPLGLGFVPVLAPVLAGRVAASFELREVLRRLRSPLAAVEAGGLARMGLGAAHLAVVAALLVAASVLWKGTSLPQTETTSWAEARDTLVIDLEPSEPGTIEEALAHLRSTDPAWHVASAGAFEDGGVSRVTIAECDCIIALMSVPIARFPTRFNSVSPGAFTDLGVPVEGREFTAADGPDAPRVAVIDRQLSRRFGRVSPIGKRIRIVDALAPADWYEIVGVVDLPQVPGLGQRGGTLMGSVYLSTRQHPPDVAQFVLTPAKPRIGPAQPSGRRAAALAAVAAEPGVSVVEAATLAERFERLRAPFEWFSFLGAGLGLAAVLLGVHGLASAMGLDVRARWRELGLRRALGARRRDIVRHVGASLGRVALWGGGLAVILASGLARGLEDRFGALVRFDGAVVLGVLAVLTVSLVAGAVGPTRRATRVTPIEGISSTE